MLRIVISCSLSLSLFEKIVFFNSINFISLKIILDIYFIYVKFLTYRIIGKKCGFF